jgi:HlyD family secretion protein
MLKKRLIPIILLFLVVAVGAFVYVGQYRNRSAELYYSGTIDATEANLAFQVSGRVNTVFVDEGQSVSKDQMLASLEKAEFIAKQNQARGNYRGALENLKQLDINLDIYRNTLPAEVERAEAAVESLRAQLKELETGYRSQEIERARLAYEEVGIAVEEAKRDKARFGKLFDRGIIAEKDRETKDYRYDTVLREYQRASKAYDLLREGYRRESIDSARAKLAESNAILQQARSNLKKIEAFEQEVRAAEAQVEAAKAVVTLADIQLRHTDLKAPFNGTVTSRNIEPGEVVSPGQQALTLVDLSRVYLKIFVGETEIGNVKPGQPVEIKIDTFPLKTFNGNVSYISPEAEFTPKIIQTRKERVKLVYLVKVIVSNPDLELKPGMPADAWLR